MSSKDIYIPCFGFLEDISFSVIMVLTVGDVEIKTPVEREIIWKIPGFLSLLDAHTVKTGYLKIMHDFKSPDFRLETVSWHLEMHRLVDYYGDINIYLYLCNDTVREYSVEYNFGLATLDGNVEQLLKGILEGNSARNVQSEASFIKKWEVHERAWELVPSGILTINGRLKFETVSSIQPSPVLDKGKLENLINLDTLSENLRRIFVNKDNCDATLRVVDKEYKAHRAILIAGSSVFAAMFQHETSEKQTGIVTIPDCDPESFEKFLEYLYTGKLEKPSPSNALHLYETSGKYNVQELKAFCAEYLMQNLTVEIFCDVVVFADKYDEENLLSAAQNFFNENCGEILDTSEWDSLVKNNYRLSKKLLKEMCRKGH